MTALALALACSAIALAQSPAKAPEESKRIAPRLAPTGLPDSLEGIFFDKFADEAPVAEQGDRAAPPNDNCSTPTFIAGVGLFPFDNAMATTDGLPHFLCNFFGQMQIERDIWYRWTAPQTATFVIDTCSGTTLDTKIAVYTIPPVCPPTDEELLKCNDDFCSAQSRVTVNATAGVAYLIRLGVFPTQAGGAGTMRIQFQAGQDVCGQPPANCQARDSTNAYEATGNYVYDDFRPAASGSITSVCFTGAYFNGVGDCQGSETDKFTISYFQSFGGVPDFFPFAEFNSTQITLIGPIPTGELINGAFPVYSYKATHPPVSVTGNQCYWIRIHNGLTGSCGWFWQKGQPGNTIAFQTNGFVGPDDLIPADLSFCFNIGLNSSNLCQSAMPPNNDSCASAQQINCFSTITLNNIFATDDPSDPPFSCRLEGPGQGSGSMWYKFTASATSAAISTCATTEGDSMLAVYSGTCGNFTELACNDDHCGRRALVTVTGLTIGQTYHIQFATFDFSARGQYSLRLDCPIPAPPSNDDCSGATLITLDQFGTGFGAGSTIFATTDSVIPACAYNPLVAPSIWFKVVGTGEQMFANLCSSNFDTKVNVYCGDSCSQLICVAQNDDECGIQSIADWCSEVGRTYYIMVHGFNGQVGQVSLSIVSSGEPCAEPAPCETCVITCPPGAIQENEPCGQFTNDGCNLNPVQVQQVPCNATICGSASAVPSFRDTDWYQFDVALESLVTWSVTADLPVEFFILDSACPATIIASSSIERCGSGTTSARVLPGTYRVFVGNIDDAYPCGTFNTYVGTLTCEPIGACCVGPDCIQTTESDCALRSGQFGGPASVCDITYPPIACSSMFEDILPTGTSLSFSNDDGAVVDIGFEFRFYGRDYTKVGVSANGYLGFETTLSNPVNVPIPTASDPNNIIAALWDDLAPFPNGGIYVETLGVAPARRFIVQWDSVRQFLQNDSNTFQAVLYEGTNCIELRYGQVTPQATPGDYTIGVEDRYGTRGDSVDGAMAVNGACFRFCPVATPTGCENTGCIGDANGDGSVDFDDITSVLANWGGSGPAGDGNGDGQVNFDDITIALANWGCAPPVCLGDASGDEMVDFDDVTTVIANWNSGGPIGDANNDHAVNFDDVTSVLANWGAACPP